MHGGWDELELFDWKGGFSRLSIDQEASLCVWLEGRICRDTNEIRAYIVNTFNVSYSHSGCIKLLHRLGFHYVKPGRVPARADEGEQRDFINRYEALLNSLPPDEVIYFGDAVHPEHQSRPAHGWIKKGSKPALKSTSGRKRMNIHGAVCLDDFSLSFTEVLTVNADSTIALFEKLEAANPGKRVIHVILDNARYHKAVKVREWLARTNCRIRPIWLPSYAPHLNSIERLWGVFHKYVTHNKFYKTFNEFAAAVMNFLNETIPKKWREFRDTVTDNFRIISHQNFRVFE